MVTCKGGGNGQSTQPTCETELIPPGCTGDPNCQSSCSAEASAKMICTPLTVTLIANVETTGDFAKLKTTIEKNLPAILLTARTKGQLAARALEKVAATGKAVVNASASLGGKAIACAGTAAEASLKASASMRGSVSASATLSPSCPKNTSYPLRHNPACG